MTEHAAQQEIPSDVADRLAERTGADELMLIAVNTARLCW